MMDAVRYLYETYHKDVYRYLVGLTRDAALAEELLSETYLSAIIALPGYRGDGEVKGWLFTIARNKWFDHLRKKRDDVSVEEVILLDGLPGPEERVHTKMMVERVMELLEQEDPRTQKIFKMRLQGSSFHEIGKAMNIREGSARVIDFRVRKRIREHLEQEGYRETV